MECCPERGRTAPRLPRDGLEEPGFGTNCSSSSSSSVVLERKESSTRTTDEDEGNGDRRSLEQKGAKVIPMKRITTLRSLLVALLVLPGWCHADAQGRDWGDGRLAICMPDGHFFNIACNPTLLGSTGARFHDILVSTNRFSQILKLIGENHTLQWKAMTAEGPYPKSHTVLLWYGLENTLNSHQMCSLGNADAAIPMLQEIRNCIPVSQRKEFDRSLETLRRTSPASAPKPKPTARSPPG